MKLGGYIASILLFFSLSVNGQTPSNHASSFKFDNVYCNEVDISWTNGTGNGRVVIAKEGSPVDGFPQDFSFYAWSDTMRKGQEIGTGNFVVYEGAGSKCTVNGLKKNTKYYFAVIEFNSNTTGIYYLTSSGYAAGDTTTENIIASFTIDDAFQCLSGNEFLFVNTSSNTMGAGMTYTWDFGDKTRKDTQAITQTYSYRRGGVFDVELIARSEGCVTSVVKEDTVVVPFFTDFVLDPNEPGNDSIQCLDGNSFKFKSTSYPPPIAYGGGVDRTNYLYTASEGNSKQNPFATFRFNTPGIKTVKLYTTRFVDNDDVGCVDSAEKVFVVLPPPLTDDDVTISDSILCLGSDDFQFTHTGDEVVFTEWSFGDNTTSNDNPAFHTYNKVGRFAIDLLVTDVDGCEGTFTDTVEVITIENNTFSGLSSEYCEGEPIVDLDPNLPGGQFIGDYVDPTDSTFDPSTEGQYEVIYVMTVGSCTDTTRQTTQVYEVPVFDLGPDTLLCDDSILQYDIGIPGLSYLWSTGATDQTIVASSGGLYWGEANDGKCKFRDSVRIRQISPPSFDLGLDTTLCGGLTVELEVIADEADYLWNDGSMDSRRTISESGYYELTVSNQCATLTDGINIEILPFACEVFVPSAFSPNGDNLNGEFKPIGYFDFERMEIFNRWGEVLYETTDADKGWDGTYQGELVQPETYFYIIYYEIIKEGKVTRESISGPVTIVR